MKVRSEEAQTGMAARRATEGPAGVLDGTSMSPKERNAADTPGSASAVEASWECIQNSNHIVSCIYSRRYRNTLET
jgi:hypothetical protein